MTDKINTLIVALWAAGIAAALQASTMLVKGGSIRWQATVGTLIISAAFGGVGTVVAIEQLHVAPVVAGALGASCEKNCRSVGVFDAQCVRVAAAGESTRRPRYDRDQKRAHCQADDGSF